MRLEEHDDAREQRRLGRPAPELSCLDSGQVKEPPRAPFVRKRGRKRGKSESIGVVWRLGRHSLDSRMGGKRKHFWPRF